MSPGTVAPTSYFVCVKSHAFPSSLLFSHDFVTAIGRPSWASLLHFPQTEQPRWPLILMGKSHFLHSKGNDFKLFV